ncbi:hypothetical protein EGW08_023509 [Elysia chlorotica]|uniref:50S ribosomal protein L13 n=1 Tax=Elysia chlorotica TaxID=188477 RepID=A0A3S0ZJ90_ELYCH|nr:hypothetical protein EGW08_023509 [Elysia chlorotica]
MKTFTAKPSNIKREWLLIDATDKTLGRLATEVAMILRGKTKPEYTPHMDTGDYVVIINADKITVTGNKKKGKIYHHHTGFIGGIKSISFEKLMAAHPERAIEKAVKELFSKETEQGMYAREFGYGININEGEDDETANPKKLGEQEASSENIITLD